MLSVKELQTHVQALPREQLTEFSRWFAEFDWDSWDNQIEADSNSGKLDFLFEEAMDAKQKGKLRTL